MYKFKFNDLVGEKININELDDSGYSYSGMIIKDKYNDLFVLAFIDFDLTANFNDNGNNTKSRWSIIDLFEFIRLSNPMTSKEVLDELNEGKYKFVGWMRKDYKRVE